MMAMFIDEINREPCYAQQYLLHEGLKRFGDKGRAAVSKEVKQMHDRTCFRPIDINEMSPEEKKKAQVALIFLTEKRDGTIKAREVYNGKTFLNPSHYLYIFIYCDKCEYVFY